MKTLKDPASVQELRDRVRSVSPQSPRKWGTMTPHQMMCHLNDSFLVAMGEKPAELRITLVRRTVLRWYALNVPIQWPKGVSTMPEADQKRGGTKPVDFERDRDRLVQTMTRFVAPRRDFEWSAHPMFGPMSEPEWLRWGYLHVDHHLRQFGA